MELGDQWTRPASLGHLRTKKRSGQHRCSGLSADRTKRALRGERFRRLDKRIVAAGWTSTWGAPPDKMRACIQYFPFGVKMCRLL